MAYTNIDDPSAYFQAFTYTGTQTNQSITLDGNSDLQPDLYWYKARNTNYHYLVDSSRGTTKYIYPNDTLVEGTVASSYVTSFDSNGVTLGGGDSGTNTGSVSFANWVWKANGGTTSSNTDGDVTSTVQVNQDAGFSIVTDGTHANTNARTIGHGLGVVPQVVIRRARNRVENWRVFHSAAGSTGALTLDNDSAYNSSTVLFTGVTSSTFGVGTDFSVNGNYSYVSYCFAEKQGYSKFGKYNGNSNTNGTFVYTGFKPAFLLIKEAYNSGNGWFLLDSAREPANTSNSAYLRADETGAEGSGKLLDLLSNGFHLRNSDNAVNGTGRTYIYMAFAENPFTTSTGVPTTAR